MTASPTLLPSAEALRLLDELPTYSPDVDQFALNAQLRKGGARPEDIRAALTQWGLRYKAARKFGPFAREMLFTADGLQQATRLAVAAEHAARFRDAGIDNIYDLGCGIGAESMAFGALGMHVTAVDIDPETAGIAAFNLAALPTVHVMCADATTIDVAPGAGQWFDPARRSTNRGTRKRLFNPDDFAPTFSFVLDAAHRHPTGIKLGPGHPHDAIPTFAEAQWTAVGTEAVELALYTGALTKHPGQWSATVITAAGRSTLITDPQIADPAIGDLGEFIYEPNPAVIRSRGIATLAHMLEATLLSREIAYLSSTERHAASFATGYRVVDVLPLKRPPIANYLRTHDIGQLTIKKRGVDIDPAAFRRQLHLHGAGSATLMLTRLNDQHVAIIVEPLVTTPNQPTSPPQGQ